MPSLHKLVDLSINNYEVSNCETSYILLQELLNLFEDLVGTHHPYAESLAPPISPPGDP